MERRPAVRVVNIGAPCAPADLPRLCDGLRDALEKGETELVECDASQLAAPDAATVDALARLQLGVRRRGARVRLRDASPELRQLIALMGLSEVMPCVAGSGLEAGRQPEEREEPGGIEEEGDLADPTA